MIPSLDGTRIYVTLFCVLNRKSKVRERENKVEIKVLLFLVMGHLDCDKSKKSESSDGGGIF